MTWLTEGRRDDRPAGDRLADLWRRREILEIPGAHNALAAVLARRAGFEALYLSGAAVSASLALPDLGVMALEEMLFHARSIVRATGLPLVVDGDTGYGEAINVMRTVAELEAAGAAAVQLEDQILPKKCGHLSDKRLAPPEAMAEKIAAARQARRSLRIIARTDAAASEGLDAALTRMRLYVTAGADAIFPEAMTSADDFRRVRATIDVPLLANMTEFGRTPLMTSAELETLGYDMVIWPVSSLRAEAAAVRDLYGHLRQHHGQAGWLDRMLTRRDLYDLIGYHDYEALDRSIARSRLPDEAPSS